MPVSSWSTTPGSNTAIVAGVTIDGAVMTPPQVDNVFRDFAAQIASQLGKTGFEGAAIASASTTNLANATGWSVDITGTTTITAFGTVDAGQVFILTFTGALTLTHNATSLILPGGASFTTAAGDVAIMKSLGSGNWKCLNYQQAVTTALTITPPTFQVFSAGGTWTKPTGCTRAVFEAVGGGGGSGGVDGQAGATGGATGGGGSGFYGMTGFINVVATVSAAVTIGAGGTAGAAAAGNGGNGGATSITIGATTYTWGGGNASSGRTASNPYGASMGGGGGGTGTNVVGGSWPGGPAILDATDANFTAGNGGSNPLGTGGTGAHNITIGTGSAAVDGVGFGAGGGGGIINGSTANQAGATGSGGYMRVWEYYS